MNEELCPRSLLMTELWEKFLRRRRRYEDTYAGYGITCRPHIMAGLKGEDPQKLREKRVESFDGKRLSRSGLPLKLMWGSSQLEADHDFSLPTVWAPAAESASAR